MATYSTPGVYIEEIAGKAMTIDGAPTAVTAFVGPTLAGPADPAELPLLVSFGDFERTYGGFAPQDAATNDLVHAAGAFFAGGGQRLHVARVPAAATAADYAQALARLDAVPEIELVAAPGAVARPGATPDEVARALIAHVEDPARRRFAVLDAPRGLSVEALCDLRAAYDSRRAALYHPWIVAADPRDPDGLARVTLPPSPFVCAAYARTDLERGVWKAPANTPPRGALGLDLTLRSVDQERLNPLGVNVIRAFDGRGILIWGARTLSSDPAFKYVSVSRFMAWVETSLDRSLDAAVFEPNAPPLWTRVVAAATAFLTDLWRQGALQGAKPEHAFVVRCGLNATMTAADVAAGRLVLEVGLAVARPAEFVILRLSKTTVEAVSS